MPTSRRLAAHGATWYVWEGNRVLLSMDESRLRLRFMRRDPRVALTVLHREGWHRPVSLLGRIVAVEEDVGLRDIDRLAVRYTGEPFRTRNRRRFSAWLEIEALARMRRLTGLVDALLALGAGGVRTRLWLVPKPLITRGRLCCLLTPS